jgi:hypothetical protein
LKRIINYQGLLFLGALAVSDSESPSARKLLSKKRRKEEKTPVLKMQFNRYFGLKNDQNHLKSLARKSKIKFIGPLNSCCLI